MPTLHFDPQEYIHHLNDTDWTETEKREFTEELWAIVLHFVDKGFPLHVQLPEKSKTLEHAPSIVLGFNDISENSNDYVLERSVGAPGTENDS